MPLLKEEKEKVIKEFAKSSTDTGSAEVQIALLTKRINELTDHLKIHRKDFASKRGLLKMVSKRRSLLKYLNRTDQNQYRTTIEQLGLKG